MANVRFDALVDPMHSMLVNAAECAEIIPREVRNSRSSGIALDPDVAARIEDKLRPAGTGEIWSQLEIRQAVLDYFDMLRQELQGVVYSKSQHRRELLLSVHRSEGSIEFKHQNISAVLRDVGCRYINGYKPRETIKRFLLVQCVTTWMAIWTFIGSFYIGVPRCRSEPIN